jgi:hypothetical protein
MILIHLLIGIIKKKKRGRYNMIIKQEIYWNLDDDNKVVIDKEEIEREFRIKLESIIEEKTGCEEEEMDEEIIESEDQ